MVLIVILVCDSGGYLFSSDILATMDKYSNDVAECVVDKAKKMCKDRHDVSCNFWFVKGYNCHLIIFIIFEFLRKIDFFKTLSW